MNHHKGLMALADALGPAEVADLARALPWLETDELARILLTGAPTFQRSLQ